MNTERDELKERLAIKDDMNNALQLMNEALTVKCKELERQLAEQGICEICKDKSVLVADKCREQNAKLVDALEEIIAISDRKHDAWDRAKAALKEMEVRVESVRVD